MSLPNDVSRCAGRFGFKPADPVCPRRESCERFRDLIAQPPNEPIWVPVSTGLCRDGDDYFIEARHEG